MVADFEFGKAPPSADGLPGWRAGWLEMELAGWLELELPGWLELELAGLTDTSPN